jgi:hypothetical protein
MASLPPNGRKVPWKAIVLVLAAAILFNSLALLGTSPDSASGSDGPFYISIARNLAAGKGYILTDSFWPNEVTMGRAPVWPAILAVPAFLFPGASDHQLLRVTAACLNILSALLFFGIAWALSRNTRAAVIAGLCYAIYPVSLALTSGGFSEIPYVFLAATGILMILLGGKLLYPGVLVMGLAPLVRSNFIALPVMVALAALAARHLLPPFSWARMWPRFAVLAGLFWLPSAMWIVRNYALSGDFPVLSTLEGEALYGANNDRVASDLADWGYWVMPDGIPGELPKRVLAQSMSERQMDRYYHGKAVAFLKQHWFELPRFEVGKMIRAFIPVPWVANWTSYAVFFFRALLYAAILLTLPALRASDPRYRLIVTGMFLVVLLTVLVYYGTYRFTFCAEVFMIPIVAIGAAGRKWKQKEISLSAGRA